MINTWLTDTFKIKYPIVMAPMFLVSNEEMLIEASKSEIMGCIPALNWRSPELFEKGIKNLKKKCNGPFGINLIVSQSNIHLQKQIEICAKYSPDFIITSLGSPEETIKKCGPQGVKIICDVTNIIHAKKIQELKADAIIAVNSCAGGHAGTLPINILVPLLKENTHLPIISAGGIGTGRGLLSVLALGAEGASIGSPFISTPESDVSDAYKQACVDYGANDIAFSTKISGTPCTVIKTPYVKKIGLKQNPIESILSKNTKLKKYIKMITYYKGMKVIEKAAFSASYKNVWCAGPSIEFVKEIKPIKEIVKKIISEYENALKSFSSKISSQR